MRPWVVIYRNPSGSWSVWRRFWRKVTADFEAVLVEFDRTEARVVHRKYVKSYTG